MKIQGRRRELDGMNVREEKKCPPRKRTFNIIHKFVLSFLLGYNCDSTWVKLQEKK